MPACIIKKCPNNDRKGNKINNGISYFRIPSDPTRNEIWSQLIRVQRNEPFFKAKFNHRLCSEHFQEDDFYTTPSGSRKLKKTAKPLLLQAPETSVEVKPRRYTNHDIITPNPIDVVETTFDCPITYKLETKIAKLQMQNENKSQRLSIMRNRILRLEKNNKALMVIIHSLVKTRDWRTKKYLTQKLQKLQGKLQSRKPVQTSSLNTRQSK